MIALENPKRRWTEGEKLLATVGFCLSYVALELVGGSSLLFASLVGVYVAAFLFAIRCNGGIKTVFGVAIFWQAVQTVLISQVARVALGKNPESRLDAAIPTILCEILVQLSYALAGLIASRITINRGRPLFPPIVDLDVLRRLAVSATILSVVRLITTGILHEGAGPLHVLNAIDPIAVGSAIGYTVIKSGGKRLLSPLVWSVIGPIIFFSLLGGGRGGIFSSVMTVILAGWIFGYRFRVQHYVLAVVGLLTMVFIVSPYSLIARATQRGPDIVQNMNASLDLMTQVVSEPLKYQFASKHDADQIQPIYLLQDYYELKPGNASNLLNRFGLIRPHDMLISDVIKNGTTGFANITPAFDYLLPTALAPNKGYQIWATGNALSHRIQGLVMDDDHTTGIVIGIPPDAFSAFGWPGTVLMPGIGLLLLILAQKALIQLDLRQNIFGLAATLMITILVSEGTLSGFVSGPSYNTALLLVAFFLTTRLSTLLNFRYLRPKPIPEPWVDGEPGVVL